MSDLEKNGLTEEETELNNENGVSEENKEILKEEEEEKAAEEVKEEAEEAEAADETEEHKTEDTEEDEIENSTVDNKTSFGDLFIANFVDVLAISAVSFIILALFQIIIKIIGYKISDTISMYLIMFILTSLFYAPICHNSKLGTTIGNKLFYLSLKRDK